MNRSSHCNVDDERPGGAGDIAADDGNAGARGQRSHPVDERIDARHGECRRQHERQKRDARRGAHGRQIAQIHRERLVADVCRADERLIEVYAFDLTIGSENFERVPLGRNDRRIVADAHHHESGRRGQALADPFNQSMFPDFVDRLSARSS